jgi:hypothetical protein
MDSRDVRVADGYPIFDTLDIDLVVKVLAHTAFSEVTLSYYPSFKQQFTFFQAHSSCFSFLFSISSRVPSSLTLWSSRLARII